IIAFVPFAYSYFGSYSRRSAVSWQYGVKQALADLRPRMATLGSIQFYNVTGAEYLVPFYERIAPQDWQGSAWRQSKFHFPPFNYPPALLRQRVHGHAAVVTLPIPEYLPPNGDVTLIHAPNSEEAVMAIYYIDKATSGSAQR